ncbi:MAG TPA: pantoate--beta-alanine ligase [Ktedonobacteraceae bacterium]|nr:pantoate--beta-alanine ligase [Ktedonobacteraceae bacterium]
MRVISKIQEMVEAQQGWQVSQRVGFVPTMGYLHEGHLTLVRQARRENDVLVASIYVNPAQFGPHEDLNTYPRDLPRDLRVLEEAGVDIVFAPSTGEIYPVGFVTYVDPTGPLAEQSEGASRRGHFRGVATVVLKLFQIVRPQRAYFGQKDGQQVAVIARMVKDFNLPVQLRVLPTVREADGLAMSSRNAYLLGEDRRAARVIYKALQAGRAAFEMNVGGRASLATKAMIDMVQAEPRARLDYAEIRDPRDFLLRETLAAPALLLIAANVGPARLIDNFLLREDGSWDTGIIAVSHD